MTIVPWATLQPSRDLVASAQSRAPMQPEQPRVVTTLWRRLNQR
ncbi:MAG TPA: hypothetical protein VFP34_19600 [Microlunatus sp.]|nr:hypothetical protein [Microlunatus sp.]